MHRYSVRGTLGITCLLTAAGLFAVPAATASAGAGISITPIASHLGNPRGLSAVGDSVYVAESGSAGSHCLADPSDPSNVTCAGLTGAIDKITDGRLQRMTDGFISVSGPGGIAAGGPAAVSVSNGRIVAIMAGNTVGVPTGGLPANILAAARGQLGRLVNVGPGDQLHPAARVGDTDFRWAQHHKNLNPQFPDSNPNGVALEHGTAYVVDAGSNTLDVVTSDGRILVLTYFGVPSGSPPTPSRPASRRAQTARCTSGNCSAASSLRATPGSGASPSQTVWCTRASGPAA